MTDKQIIKALECCLDISPSTCKNCSLFNVTNSTMVCSKIATKFALDLINRQKAENERLQKLLDNKCDRCIANERAEAVREFAERLKDVSEHFWEEKENFVSEDDIDNLVKEMVGDG